MINFLSFSAGAGTLRSWVVDRNMVDQLTREREACQQNLNQLIKLLDIIEHQDDMSVSFCSII